MPLPNNWEKIVQTKFTEKEIADFTNCIKRSCPYGEKDWTAETAELLNLQPTLIPRGRPGKYPEDTE